jgi:uncharacterized protein YkwD
MSHTIRGPDRLGLVLLIALWTAAAAAIAVETGPPRGRDAQSAAASPLEEIERDLLLAVNNERAAGRLPALRLSSALVGLARRHSAEMARRNVLSHESATGKSFTDRLVAAAVPFAANGENVARSGTFLAEVIHRSFMESPGHRQNVLSPEFDEVGIGIVRGAGGLYYVTEDFIRSLVEKPRAEVRGIILGVLNRARAVANLPPVVLVEEADRTALAFAASQASGRTPSSVPAFFGQTLVRLAAGPDIGMTTDAIKDKDLARYGRAGIGVQFGRSPAYPGGAYFICVLLIRDGAAAGPDELDRLLTVLGSLNAVKARNGLEPLILDAELSRRADEVIAWRRQGQADNLSVRSRHEVFFYMFQKLNQVEPQLRRRIEDRAVRRVGISTLPVETEDGRLLSYAVAVILGR